MKLKDIFNFHTGNSSYTKDYVNKNTGLIPLISGKTCDEGVMGYINNAHFENKYGLTISLVGYAGTVFKRENFTFSLSNNVVFLDFPKNSNPIISSNITLDYLWLWLYFNIKKKCKGNGYNTISHKIIGEIDIPLYGDLEAQSEYVLKYRKIYDMIELSKKTINHLSEIKNKISIEDKYIVKEYLISDLIDMDSSNAGFLTQKFVNQNKGNIPVYGASEFDKPTYGYILDNIPKIKYFNDCFRYNRNGSFGVFVTKGRFTVSNDVRVFSLKPQYLNLIDPEYFALKLKKVYFENNLRYGKKAGKDRFLKLSVKMIDLSLYSILEQQKIAKRFNDIENIKHILLSKLISI